MLTFGATYVSLLPCKLLHYTFKAKLKDFSLVPISLPQTLEDFPKVIKINPMHFKVSDSPPVSTFTN